MLSDCHSVYQQTREHKIFDLFVARVVQKLNNGNGPFSHILCSSAICRCVGCPDEKNVPNFSAGVSIELHVTTLIEAACMPPSLT